jgi:hypothetical protein
VFDLTLPLDQVAQGYRAMDERRAIKTLLRAREAGVAVDGAASRRRGQPFDFMIVDDAMPG